MAQRLEIIISAKDQASRTFGSITGNMQKIGKIALGVTAGGLAAVGAGIIGLATKAVPAASDVTESMNAVNKVFEESAQTVIAWGDKAATQAGLAKSEFFQMSAQTGAMLQNLGIEQSKAAEESVNLAQRAADMASIFNTDVSEALGAIQAGLRGEADPLERFGVRLNAAAVASKAVEMGLAASTKEVDDAARAQAALALLYEQTDKLAGDFVDTSGDLANAQRVAGAQWQNFLATIGKIGLPILGKFFNLLSTSVLPVLNTFAQYIGFVVDEGDTLNDFLADLPGWLQPIVQTIGEVIVTVQEFIAEFIRGFEATGDPIAAFMEALDNILPEETIEKIWTFIDSINNVIDTVSTALQPIIAWAQENIKLQDILAGLAIAIGVVVVPAIVSIVAPILGLIATFAAITAAIALLRTAWENNWGGIQEKTQAAIAFIGPLIDQLSQFWTNTLLPAIKDVWTFLTVDMMPVWEALGNLLSVTVKTAIEVLAALWENVLKPALETVWEFIQNNVIPIFDNLSSAVGGVTGAISTVVGWINDLATAIANLPDNLPGWLQRHSPSPFELVFMNVNKELDRLVTANLPKLQSSLAISVGGLMPATVGGVSASPFMAGGSSTIIEGDTIVHQHFYDEGAAALGQAAVFTENRRNRNAWMGG